MLLLKILHFRYELYARKRENNAKKRGNPCTNNSATFEKTPTYYLNPQIAKQMLQMNKDIKA